MKSVKYLFISLFLLLLLAGCQTKDKDRLTLAMQVANERPDSAYILLKEIDYNSISNDRDKACFILVQAQVDQYMNRSLIADTLLPKAMSYFKSVGDTTSYIDAAVAYANHLRALDKLPEAYNMVDSISSDMPEEIRRMLNQHLLGLSIKLNDREKTLEIINRQIELSDTGKERLNFEIKKIVPLLLLGRSAQVVALCDSLFSLPEAPEEGTVEWSYMRLNYATALGERRATAGKAKTILEEIIDRQSNLPITEKIELYIPMVNICLNADNVVEAERYVEMIEKSGVDLHHYDPVAEAYFEILKIAIDYKKEGALSLTRIGQIARNLRQVSNDLEIKRHERDDAMESAYALSRDKYELTIRQQRMWLIILLAILIGGTCTLFFWYLSRQRRNKLIEAEDRIATLEELLQSATNPATDEKQGLLKRLLLQQMGILKTFAESPTTQNRDALRKITNIGNSDTPIDSLVKWDDLFTSIDELYSGFHQNLLKCYPDLFSEREIQIISLIRAGFTTKEIGVLLQQTPNSIYVSKTAIRKKLGLQAKEDFMGVLTPSVDTSAEA